MQLHHAVEYNLFEHLASEVKYWAELAVIGPLLLGAAVVVVPVALTMRAARGIVRWATAPYWFVPEPMDCEEGLRVAR